MKPHPRLYMRLVNMRMVDMRTVDMRTIDMRKVDMRKAYMRTVDMRREDGGAGGHTCHSELRHQLGPHLLGDVQLLHLLPLLLLYSLTLPLNLLHSLARHLLGTGNTADLSITAVLLSFAVTVL